MEILKFYMLEKNIELELRAEVNLKKYFELLKKFNKNALLISHTKRLTFMAFGKIQGKIFDIRIRITNGQTEIVIKKGSLHAHNRIEKLCPINKSQFIDLVKLFDMFEFNSEVAERETHNFNLKSGIVLSLINAGKITYIEIEKMSNKKNVEANRNKLLKILNIYNLKPITKKSEFDDLCKRLSKYSDWPFRGSRSDYNKLKKLLAKY